MNAIFKAVPWLFLTAFFLQVASLKVYSQPAFPDPDIKFQKVHEGDLELTGDTFLLLEHTHLRVSGNVILKDSAEINMRQSILELTGFNTSIFLLDNTVLQADTSIFGGADAADEIDASKAEMLKGGNLLADLNAKLILNNCFSQTQTFMGNSVVIIKNSYLVKEPLGIVHVEANANVLIEDSYIGAIYLDLPPDISISIDSLFPGYLEKWSAKEKIDSNLSFDMVLRRCHLSENTLGYKGGMEMGWNIAVNAISADISISNSVLNKLVMYFPQDEPAVFSGLKLREPIDFEFNTIHIENTEIQTQWGVFMKGGHADLVNSEGLFIFMDGGKGDVIVNNSEVGEIDPRGYTGNLIFENSTWHSGYEIWEDSHIHIHGSVRMLPTVPIFDSTSTMIRSFEIYLRNDRDGTAFSDVDLILKLDTLTVWMGTTDEEGRVDLSITFDINNASRKWSLLTTDTSIRLNKSIGIQNSNPIYINLEPESDGKHFRNCVHVQTGNESNPSGTRDNPYPNIQEAILNSGGDIIYVHQGRYAGWTEPGAEKGNISMIDNVTIIGDGPAVTNLNAEVGFENVSGVQLVGFTITEPIQAITSSAKLMNNVIKSSSPTAIWAFKSDLEIINNTIFGNEMDAIFLHDSCSAIIKNNIIVNNGIGINGFENTKIDINYNDIWGNKVDYFEFFSPGEYDISYDPLFKDAGNNSFFLQPGSPCIDAGDPDPRMKDPDGSRNDMGAFGGPFAMQKQTNAVITTLEQRSWHIFPNPVSSDLWVEILPKHLPATIRLYSINGRILTACVANEPYTKIDMNQFQSGIYLVEINIGGTLHTRRIIKKK
jgi:hypothetical protein